MYKKSNFDKFRLYVDEFVCNKFGFAELFTENYFRLEIKPKNALDVGCGVGPLSIFLADKDIYVDAIDINPIATKLCNLNVNKYRLNKYLNIICDDFSAYNFSVGGRIRSVSQSGIFTYALVFDDAFTNKYSVYSLNLDNGNVSQNTFVDENFMTNSFSVTDNRIYYIKTDSLNSYVACRDFASEKKS